MIFRENKPNFVPKLRQTQGKSFIDSCLNPASFFPFRTPPQFLHEIVLVDDKSEMQHLHEPLDEELRKPYYQSKVKVVRNKEREGLIRARNNGAIAASGNFDHARFLLLKSSFGLGCSYIFLGEIFFIFIKACSKSFKKFEPYTLFISIRENRVEAHYA